MELLVRFIISTDVLSVSWSKDNKHDWLVSLAWVSHGVVVLILKLGGTIDTEKQALLKRMLGSVAYPSSLEFFFLFGERAGKSDEIELLT